MADSPRTLAEPARDWIAQRVASGDWPDESAYLSDLVARDREQAEKFAALHAALDEGLASGFVEMTMEEIFAEARARNISAAA
jgi:antitoxin ParD1/3/4